MLTVLTDASSGEELAATLDEVCREGARRMLAAALELDVDHYLIALRGEVDATGRRPLDWDDVANPTVAILRTEAGRDPSDRNLTDLIGELATRSDDFRVRWPPTTSASTTTAPKRFHHPVIGDPPSPSKNCPCRPTPA